MIHISITFESVTERLNQSLDMTLHIYIGIMNGLGRRFTAYLSIYSSISRHSILPTFFYSSKDISNFQAGSHRHHPFTYFKSYRDRYAK